MKHKSVVFSVMLTVVITLLPAMSFSSNYVPGQILVKFKPGTNASEVAKLHRQNASRVMDEIPQIGVQKVSTPRGRELARAKMYLANPNVEFAEPDSVAYAKDTIPNDPWFTNGQWGMKMIQAPAAWDISTGSESVPIAVVDSGVEYTHPDLASRMLPGYDFYNNDSDPMDDDHHGTHMAGIIGAATDNGIGVVGVTWKNPLIPIKVLSAVGYGSYSVIAKGVIYAADNGTRVINMSLGGASSSTLKSAVDYAYSHGAVVVAASGNESASSVCYPAAYPNVIAVGASDGWDKRASFSNYGPELDVLAPCGLMSTCLYGRYESLGGTSLSTAYVSGVCGLILSVNPSLSPAQVMQIIRETADDIAPDGWDQYSGWGRVNAYKAVVRASGQVTVPSDTVPPCVDLISPSVGSTVSGSVTLSASASDNVGVSRVEFYLDGSLLTTSSQAPFSSVWDTSKVSNGSRMLSAKAFDLSGNAATSTPVTIAVKNPTISSFSFTGSLTAGSYTNHQLQLTEPSTVSASLNWSKGNLDLYLLDSAGTVVASSKTGLRPEKLSTGLLAAGRYTLRAVCISGKTRYTLSVTCSSQ